VTKVIPARQVLLVPPVLPDRKGLRVKLAQPELQDPPEQLVLLAQPDRLAHRVRLVKPDRKVSRESKAHKVYKGSKVIQAYPLMK
jgi:hypothetical protein